MKFFRIIIPNYNNGKLLDRSVGSVINQLYKDYELIIVDDCSTDGSRDYLETVKDVATVVLLDEKRYNGGSRNVGIDQKVGQTQYTLFLDSDDWLNNGGVLQDLHDFIVDQDFPDCVRLPYMLEYDNGKRMRLQLDDNDPEKLTNSCFIACWTKCVKSNLVAKFPENTLMEDVVQHIAQCDVLNRVEAFTEPVVVYNRNNPTSCTAKGMQDLRTGKWQSSMFRYMADLLDLDLKHDYCKEQRDLRVRIWQNDYKNGSFTAK